MPLASVTDGYADCLQTPPFPCSRTFPETLILSFSGFFRIWTNSNTNTPNMRVRKRADSILVTIFFSVTIGNQIAGRSRIATRSLQSGVITVTELRVDHPLGHLSDPIPDADAYMISLMLSDLPHNCYWEGGRQVSRYSLRAGEVTFHDLRRGPMSVIDKPIHSLLLYLLCAALHAVAEQVNPLVSAFNYDPWGARGRRRH